MIRPRRMLAILGLWAAAHGAAAEVHVWFEPRIVDELDSITLNVRATDTQLPDAPDLSVLEADFEILGTQTTSQRRSVNGNVESWVDYQYTLRPRRSGEIAIPPIRVGDQYSAATTVIVRALDPTIKNSIARMVYFETELTENPVYVQAQTVFVRRLYYAAGVQLYSDLPGIPDVANAVIIPLGETRSSSTLVEGTRYGVIEQRFAIFPEQSGALTVPESAITSSVRLRRDGRTRRSGIRISAPAQTLTVLPIPAEYPDDAPWLPAADVRLLETWSPNRTTFDAGDPMARSIAVTAVGNTGSAIPPLQVDFPDEHFKYYPESPVLDDDASGDQVIGNRIEDYSLIPTRPGAIALAPVSLTWWDTNAQRVRVAQLPPRSLMVSGGAGYETTPPEAQEPLPDSRYAPLTAPAELAPEGTPPDWLPLLVVACLIAGTALVWRWRHLVHAPRIAMAQSARRTALRELKTACAKNHVPDMRRSLLHLMTVVYEAPQAQALTRFLAEPSRAALWQRINAAAFGPGVGAPEQKLGGDLWRAARPLTNRDPAPASPALPPLYSD